MIGMLMSSSISLDTYVKNYQQTFKQRNKDVASDFDND